MGVNVTVETTTTLYPRGNGAVNVKVQTWEHGVTVTVDCMPGYSWWSCPDAATLRRLVDRALIGTGRKRDGARVPSSYRTNGWQFRYPTTRQG